MAGRRLTRKEIKKDDFHDFLTRVSISVEENWKQYATIAVGVIGAIVLVFAGVTWMVQSRAQSAERLAAAQALLVPSSQAPAESSGAAYPAEVAGIETALAAFDPLAEEGGMTGRLASYYRGALLLRLSRADEAEQAFQSALEGAKDPMLRGLVRKGLATAAVAKGDLETAESRLRDLSDSPEPGFPMDLVLYDLAMIQSRAGQTEEARRTVQRLALEHPDSPLVAPARQVVPADS